MTDHVDGLGGRLPLANPTMFNPQQRAIFIDIAFFIGIYHAVCAELSMFAIPAPELAGHQ